MSLSYTNGIPVIPIELKTSGVDISEAVNLRTADKIVLQNNIAKCESNLKGIEDI